MPSKKVVTLFSLILAVLVWTAMGISVYCQPGAMTLNQAMFPEFFSLEAVLRIMAPVLCLFLGLFASNRIATADKTNAEIRESERRFRLAFKATKDGLWDYNARKNTVYFNPQYLEMLGYHPHELPQSYETWKSLLHPDDRDPIIRYIQDQIKKKEQYSVEFRMQTKSGDWMWILGRGQVLERDEKGNPIRRVGTHSNITERKEMEEELIKARKLESIGRLAGGMAHDYNNLLTVIIGAVNLVQQDATLNPESASLLNQAENTCVKAAKLTKKLLTFSEAGAPIKIYCDLNEHIKAWVTETLTGSNCRWELEAVGPMGLRFDPDQIKRAVRNIIVNADEAMPEGGIIRICLENVEFLRETIVNGTVIPRGEYSLIEICDQGNGISKPDLSKIFDPYFSTKERSIQKGMGMGLTTAYSIIKKHGGYITVASGSDCGARFCIYLPAGKMD